MQYSKEFKQQAIKLSDEIGIREASNQLGLPYTTLGDWRKTAVRSKIMGDTPKENEEGPLTEREKKLMKELMELREANNILKDAFRFFVNDRKK